MLRLLEYGSTFAILVILQEFVFDNINIGGVVNPYIYIMFILMLPLEIPGWLLLLLGFGAGATIDFTAGTVGIQTICSTWLACVRPTVVSTFIGKDEVYDGGIPTAGRLGPLRFIRYVAIMVLLFNIPLFILEDLGGSPWIITLRIVCSSLFSTIIIYFLHLPFVNTKVKM